MAKKISEEPKLIVELIPKTCHFSNVRTTLKTKDWNTIRFISYENANHQCEICGQNGIDQGYKHRVECHEIWKYNNRTKTQKLIGLISLCPLCHQVKHIGRAFALGKQPDVFKQLEIVNDWDHKQVVEHVAQAFETYKLQSKYEWKLDISILSKPPYNIPPDKIVLPVKRKFKKTKYKRRKRRK
jgi:hypothetical protein